MATLKELRSIRLEKLTNLRELGVDPFPAKTYRNTDNLSIFQNFDKFNEKEVIVAGRIISIRGHGRLMFIDITDSTSKIQLYVKSENFKEANHKYSELAFDELFLLDEGDFVEGRGRVVKTQRGEISVEVVSLRILVKSLRPLPDHRDGLKDKEIRLRRRYLDTNTNKDVYDRFVRRSRFWKAHRDFFETKGFIEMNIPVLEAVPGGADANPFVTHMDAIDQDFYLRISQELYLKRLIGGGYNKVFEIGPRFRNEGLSDEHLPEHMAMEFYWAYADWEEGMEFVKDLFDFILDEVYEGRKEFNIRDFKVDFSKWEIIDFSEIMKKRFDIDIYEPDDEVLKKALSKQRVKGDFEDNVNRNVDNLWKSLRSEIGGPAFLINHPKFLSPLSKSKVENPDVTERFQPIVAGSELGNGWSELNDPIDQLERFREQQGLRESGDKEAQWLDIDFVEMLEYGMPPTFGYGHSERVFWFLENVSAREGVPFPQLKFELDETTKEIYGL